MKNGKVKSPQNLQMFEQTVLKSAEITKCTVQLQKRGGKGLGVVS